MTCYRPLQAYKTDDGNVVFNDRGEHTPMQLPCGRCIGCRIDTKTDWTVRIMNEASLYTTNSFLTLTYDTEHLPYGGDLVYRDYQLFMKRLKKKYAFFDVRSWQWLPRFYMCGEYGDENKRPHFHAVIFGYAFCQDRKLAEKNNGQPLYTSKILEKLWGKGQVRIADLTYQSAAYVAGYVTKKITGKKADEHYTKVVEETGEVIKLKPEFAKMSLKPGIGARWINEWSRDVYPRDFIVLNGKQHRPPKYYDTLMKEGSAWEKVEYERWKKGESASAEDSTPERLKTREQVREAKSKTVRRRL